MKKVIAFALVLFVVCFSACAKEPNPEETIVDVADAVTENSPTGTDETTPAEDNPSDLVAIDGMNITIKDDGSGTSEKENGIEKEPVLTNNNIGFQIECGPMLFSINRIQISKTVSTNDSVNSFLGIESGQEFTMIAIDVACENTSDEDVSFYPDQSELITDQKEQIVSELFLNDAVGGDFLGKVEKSGTIYFVAKKSPADAIGSFTLRIDSPHNSNFDHFGENLAITFNLSK